MNNLVNAKQLILTTSQDLVNQGFLIATGGNISTRVAGEEAFAITPSNTDYLKMKPEDICTSGVFKYAGLNQYFDTLPF